MKRFWSYVQGAKVSGFWFALSCLLLLSLSLAVKASFDIVGRVFDYTAEQVSQPMPQPQPPAS